MLFEFITYIVYLFIQKDEYINLYYSPTMTPEITTLLSTLNIKPELVEEYGIRIRYRLGEYWKPLTVHQSLAGTLRFKTYENGQWIEELHNKTDALIYGSILIDNQIINYIQWDSLHHYKTLVNIMETEYLLFKNDTHIPHNIEYLNTIPKINIDNKEELDRFNTLLSH